MEYALASKEKPGVAATGTRMRFCDIRTESAARIVSLGENTPELQRLQEMGLTLGSIFRVEKIAPFGDPIEISVRGYRLCLRKREAHNIEIELINEVV